LERLSNESRYLLARQSLKFQQALRSPAGAARLAYLVEGRGLSEETIAHFQLGAVEGPEEFGDELAHWARGRISIPFLTPTGTVLIRYMEPPPRRPGGVKYWQPAGTYIGLYNTSTIVQGGRRVVLCEGEIDTMTLWQVGLPAVGIPGAGNWSRRGHYPTIFEGYEEVIFVQEDDEKQFNDDGSPRESAAERLAAQVTEDLGNVRVVKLPRGFDSNDILTQQGPDALRDLIKFPHGGYL